MYGYGNGYRGNSYGYGMEHGYSGNWGHGGYNEHEHEHEEQHEYGRGMGYPVRWGQNYFPLSIFFSPYVWGQRYGGYRNW